MRTIMQRCLSLTRADAVDEARRHDHLEGLGASAEEHQHSSAEGHTVVEQEASFPGGGAAERWSVHRGKRQSLALLLSPTSQIY